MNRFAVIFFTLVNAATAGGAVIPSVVQERAVFYREQAAGSYRAITYLSFQNKQEQNKRDERVDVS